MAKIIIKNGLIINRGESRTGDLLMEGGHITRLDRDISDGEATVVDAKGCWVIPGLIDDQVHFRQPGLEYKANIYSESRAAVAGGVTSFMEMPNTKPPATTQALLEQKYQIGARDALANYSFFMGATNDNLDEVLRTDAASVCGIKVFMGSSTGNMLVDNARTLEGIFSKVHMLVATHCEDEATIRNNMARFAAQDQELTADLHPIIRSREGCLKSSSLAVGLAREFGTRLHVLHISTKEELDLFDNTVALSQKKITAEACVHHLYFNDTYYHHLGNKVKCNPAIKSASDQQAILEAVKDGRIDVIATDHAPHTIEEKSRPYPEAPSGLPLVQHALAIMLDFYHKGLISKEMIVEKMCHAPADLFRVKDRGYLDEGAFADVVIVDANEAFTVHRGDLLYKCGWSPLEGMSFPGRPTHTFVNGVLKYDKGQITSDIPGQRLSFIKS